MAGVPAIHALPSCFKTWMPGARPGMTVERWVQDRFAIC
jgi:hypothetical protein